jgi:hypothetical protein
MFDDLAGEIEFFSCRISPATVLHWKSEGSLTGAPDGKSQVFCQAELLAVPVALKTWEARLAQRDAVFFVDNDPAKDALVHGISSSSHSSELVRFTRLACARLGIGAWYERVPSPSNIADDPSRGEYSVLRKLGAVRVDPLLGDLCKLADVCAF